MTPNSGQGLVTAFRFEIVVNYNRLSPSNNEQIETSA